MKKMLLKSVDGLMHFILLSRSGKKKLSLNDQYIFFLTLYRFVHLGLLPIEAMAVFRTQSSCLKKVATYLERTLKKGHCLSDAIGQAPYGFDSLVSTLLKMGEQTGKLHLALGYVVGYVKKMSALQASLKEACRYPLFTLVVLFGSTFFLIQAFGSHLHHFLEAAGSKPSLSTRFLMKIPSLFEGEGLLIVMASMVFASFACVFFWRRAKVRVFVDFFLSYIPALGPLFLSLQWTHFFYLLALGSRAELPLSKVLVLASGALRYTHLSHNVSQVIEGVRSGQPLSVMLEGHRGLKPETFALMRTAEQAGDAIVLYEAISTYYQDDLTFLTKRLQAYLGPCLLIMVGGVFIFVIQGLIAPFYDQVFLQKGGL